MQKPVGFSEQDGEDDPTDPGQGVEDRHVILLARLPQRGLRGQLVAKGCELMLGLLELPVDEPEAGDEGRDGGADACGHAGGDVQGRLAQEREHAVGVEAADVVSFQQAGNAPGAQVRRCGRRRCQGAQGEEPLGAEIVGEFERLGIVAAEVIAQAMGEPPAILRQFLGQARPFAQLEHERMIESKVAEAMGVGAQGMGEHVGIAGVVLGAGDAEAIAEAVELLGVDGEDQEAALQQGIHHGAVRHLDDNHDLRRHGAALLDEPSAQRRHALAAMGEAALALALAAAVEQMQDASEVDKSW